ncbi:MAG: bifunctional glycosyltransferase family 2/GtrA family protein [Bacilli bacterium]|nr:bifunctional glycosyltransferase family 2/GtrA family protein [Bacilli bacterium]
MHRIALIPSYEPDNKLIKIVKDLLENNFKVVVVNDGSNKDYDKIFNKVKELTKVLEYDTNQGKGYALKYGMQYIKDNYDKYIVVTMDSDGQHTVKDATKLCNYVEENPNEFVIGKRIRGKNTPLRSKIGNSITMLVYKLVTGVSIYDTQTGLRCFSNQLMDFSLNVKGNRFEYEMNVLLEAPLNNIKITEIEIETIYYKDNNKKSHFNTIKDSYRVYKEILKFSLSSIISFIIDYISYIIFILLLNNITISNIFARIISATCNYTINKKLVFNSKRKITNSLPKYIILAISILAINTIILNCLVTININKYLAKIIVELLLFIFSYFIQKKRIF